jgi:sugar phosphate isomerase/epimerase
LEEAAARISQLGFSCIDILAREGWAHIDPSRLAKDPDPIVGRVSELLGEQNLTVSGINAALTTPLPRCTPPLGELEEAQFGGLLQLAEAVGSPVLTLGPGAIDNDFGLEQSLINAGRALAELVKRAEDRGIRLAVEIHAHGLIEQIESAWTVAEPAPGLGFTLDPSHFACMEIPLSRVSEILSHVYHVHLRDGKVGNFNVPLAEGDIDFLHFKRTLSEGGYDGYAAIEYISTPETDVTEDIVKLKTLWEEAPTS